MNDFQDSAVVSRVRMTAGQLEAFLDATFPSETRGSLGEVVFVQPNHVRMKLEPTSSMARPGGIVSGPTQMALVDVAAYAAISAENGPEMMAVTHSLSISFLRSCKFETIIADARLIKLGRRMATVDVRLWQISEDRMVAQSTVGYALP